MFYVYILYADKFDKFYIGQTNNIQVRVQRHNSGSEKATMPFYTMDFKILYRKTNTQGGYGIRNKIEEP
ncbi:MAG: GIY-YIG nuclease family protein [Bacteroidetes bacterium]|nr:GIY-YIG nuclease family protein [Bacteroidota bacterium]